MRYYINPADYDDPEPPPPAGRCVGWDKGCGRFVANGGTLCPRCKADADAWLEADINEDKRITQAIAEEAAYWDAYWKSPEGLAEMARDAARVAEYEADYREAQRQMAREEDDDLPY